MVHGGRAGELAWEEPARPAERVLGLSVPTFFLLLGLLSAPLFAWLPELGVPWVGFMGWFLRSLVHELGHCAVGWALGMPSLPAIRLDGHAATLHAEPFVPLGVALWIGCGIAAWRGTGIRARPLVTGAVVLLYPALAFSSARELLCLLGGHAGELAFGVLCLWRTAGGGFTCSGSERALYGTLGWYVIGSNLWLSVGLATRASARSAYGADGSFGLANDYVRLAERVLGGSLPAVGVLMTLAVLALLAGTLLVFRRVSARPD